MTALEDRVNPVGVWPTANGDASEPATPNSFTLFRDNSVGPLNVSLSFYGTAIQGIDYTSLGLIVAFEDGESSKTVGIAPIDDAAYEGTETIVLSVMPSNDYNVVNGPATMNLYDNDTSPPPPPPPMGTVTVSASIQGGNPTEGGSSAVRFTRIGSTTGNLVVTFTTAGSATPGVDYNLTYASIPA